MRCAVVGHVEWVEFAPCERMPAAGQIAQPPSLAGGGRRRCGRRRGSSHASPGGASSSPRSATTSWAAGRAAIRRARRSTCTSGGSGRRAGAAGTCRCERGAHDHALGEKLLPRGPLPLRGYDAVFFVSGEVEALRSAAARAFSRRPRASCRPCSRRRSPRSAHRQRPGSRRTDRRRTRRGRHADGRRGGGYRRTACTSRRRRSRRPVVDTYGAGDSFSAALCFALARGDDLPAALALAARAGAAVVTGRGPYDTQLALDE